MAIAPRAAHAESTSRLTLLVVLGAETVLFGTILMVYLFLRGNDARAPLADRSGTTLLLPVVNTALLLLSTATAAQSARAIGQGAVGQLKGWLLATVALGLVFVGGQIVEFERSGMRPDDEAFGGVFFTLIGFHALHVLTGIVILIINTVRAHLGDFSVRQHIAVSIGTWFWYYVAGVWVVLFAALYLL